MKRIEEKPERYIATLARILDADGAAEAARLVRSSNVSVEKTGYDNWNGGTTIWTISLEIAPDTFAQLGEDKKDSLEETISGSLRPIIEQFSTDWFSVRFVPRTDIDLYWRDQEGEISATARSNIIDGLKINKVSWWGSLDEVEFLSRIFDLDELPSHDSRFQNAASDIWQHRENNYDWDDNWIYGDPRFNLLRGPTDKFLKFLCEIVHPVVRPDKAAAAKLVSEFNEQLQLEGWRIEEEEKIAGRPKFVAKRLENISAHSLTRGKAVAESLNAGWMQKEIQRVENAVETDPALAIGTAKELVESCCKSILEMRNVDFPKSADLPKLTKLIAGELKLVPDGIPDEARGAETIKLLLRNLSAMTQYLSELRGMYGTGHGRQGSHRGLEPRHARLAVGAAVAYIDFVTSTHHRRGKPPKADD